MQDEGCLRSFHFRKVVPPRALVAMKIAIVYDVIYPFSIGGGEKNNWEIAHRLADLGHEVSLVTSHMWAGDRMTERSLVKCVGVCKWLGASNHLGNRSILQPLIFAWGTYRFLRRKHLDFDVVLCCAFPYLSCLAAKAAIGRHSTPLAIMWYEARGMRAWVAQAGIAFGCAAAFFEKIVSWLSPFNQTISEFTAQRMVKLLHMRPDSITVIHCGVDVRSVIATKATEKEPIILSVGRLVRHKRTEMLLEAFAYIADSFPEHRLHIVGKGVQRDALEKLAAALGLAGRIRFLDTLSTEDVYKQFGKAQAFVLPSEQEGFGIVVIEAMAAGTPVLARRAPLSAAADIIADGEDGLMFETTHGLAEKLRAVLSDSRLSATLIEGGLRTAAAHDWDKEIVPSMERWLSSISSKRTSLSQRLPKPV